MTIYGAFVLFALVLGPVACVAGILLKGKKDKGGFVVTVKGKQMTWDEYKGQA